MAAPESQHRFAQFLLAGIALAGFSLAAPLPAGAPEEPEVFEFPADHLKLVLIGMRNVVAGQGDSRQLKGFWEARIGLCPLEMELYVLSSDQFGFHEPADVTELVARNRDRGPDGATRFRFDGTRLLQGDHLGWAGYAELSWASTGNGPFFCLAGLTEEHAFALEVSCSAVPNDEERAALETFLARGLEVTSTARRDPAWSEEEATERWLRDAPAELRDELTVVRTEHYIVLTNTESGVEFGAKMERCHDAIRGVYPFEDVAGQRLLPVFLFRERTEYAEFFARIAGISTAEALRSAGHASRDYYATTYEAPDDPLHVHEATHQIFKNRLRLDGGGSWFQEGVAEYVETSPADRRAWARRAIDAGTWRPLVELVQLHSLLYSSGEEALDHYAQAASIIEFLRDGDWRPELFGDFLDTVGRIPRGNLAALETALFTVYGVGLEGLEERWLRYWNGL